MFLPFPGTQFGCTELEMTATHYLAQTPPPSNNEWFMVVLLIALAAAALILFAAWANRRWRKK